MDILQQEQQQQDYNLDYGGYYEDEEIMEQHQQQHIVTMEIVGFIGGSLIAVSLVPQVLKTYQTKSATDISYFYQGIYIVGLSFVNVYGIAEQLWPVYIPALFELSMIITLVIMKLKYDDKNNKKSSPWINKEYNKTKNKGKTTTSRREHDDNDERDENVELDVEATTKINTEEQLQQQQKEIIRILPRMTTRTTSIESEDDDDDDDDDDDEEESFSSGSLYDI